MKAVVVNRAKAAPVITDFAEPTIGPRDVLIRVKACGVCHSDLHLVIGDWEWDIIKLPLVLGHEVTGVVEVPLDGGGMGGGLKGGINDCGRESRPAGS